MVERILPAEIAHVGRNHRGNPLLYDVHRVPQLTARSVTVVVISPGRFGSSNTRVVQALAGDDPGIRIAERVAVAGCEVTEGHADFRRPGRREVHLPGKAGKGHP